jgi:DNA-binding NarL/FixJ family response regulator
MATKIAVQQRQRLFREGLGQLVTAEDDMELVGAASTSEDILAVCQQECPDAALIEADPVDWDAGRLTRALRRAVPRLRVVGLSTEEMSPADVAAACRSGMRTIVPRSAGMGQILGALRATSAAARPADRLAAQRTPPGDPFDVRLTPRELTILNLVGAGFTSREISSQLTISHKTVENHKQRIFGKLGVQNQAHAVSVAMRRGLMRPERVIGLSRAD